MSRGREPFKVIQTFTYTEVVYQRGPLPANPEDGAR